MTTTGLTSGAQSRQTVARPHLVRFDERPVCAVRDHHIVQRESTQEISGNAADVDESVTVTLYQSFDVATDALATPVGICYEEKCTK